MCFEQMPTCATEYMYNHITQLAELFYAHLVYTCAVLVTVCSYIVQTMIQLTSLFVVQWLGIHVYYT